MNTPVNGATPKQLAEQKRRIRDGDEVMLPDISSFFFLLSFAKNHSRKIIIGIGLLIGASTITMISARLLGTLVQEAVKSGSSSATIWLAVCALSLETVALLIAYIGRRVVATTALSVILVIRQVLFKKLAELPLSFFDRTPQGRTITRLTNDVESLEEFFSSTLGRLLSSCITALIALLAMILTAPLLGLVVVISVVPAIFVTLYARTPYRRINRDIVARNSQLNAQLSEFIQGIEIIRLFGIEQWTIQLFEKIGERYQRAVLRLNSSVSILRPIIGSLSSLPLVVIVAAGGDSVIGGTMSLASFIAFIRYYERFGRPLMELSMEFQVVQQAFTSAERLATLLHEKTEAEVVPMSGKEVKTTLSGEIEFRDVQMRYSAGDNLALNSVSFAIKPGQRIGLTGASGSGKSSTVALLLRLYEFQAGEILIDGVPIRDFDRGALRRAIGFVSQEVMVVRGTVRENLDSEARFSSEHIESIAAQTGLLKVLKRRGMNLDAELLERAANLSAGERQLLAVTRMVLRSPSVIILDEATAHIDHQLERELDAALQLMMQGKTIIIIAHRLHTIVECDQILVFNEGQVVAHGDHAYLLEHSPVYAELWRRAA